jgi:hypothetical protein
MSRVTFLAILLLAAAGAPAQKPEAEKPGVEISAEMLINLHQAGLGKDHISKVLDHKGVPTLSSEDLKAVKAAGLPAEILQRLEQAASPSGMKPLTIESIVQMVKAGVATETIIFTIKSSGSTFELTPQQVVDLIIDQKVPGDVVKAMTATKTEKSAATKVAKMVSLDDIARYTAAGMTIEWILNRIRETNSRFDATPDDLIKLSRKNVHADVLGEIWNRTPRNKVPDTRPARPPEEGFEAPKPVAAAISYRDHVDEGLGFSLSVPDGWPVHKERKGPNDLLSFSDKSLPADGGLSDEEIQVARFRASHPERLTDTNLLPIARNFINALRNNFQSRGVTMTSEEDGRTWLSGRSAVAWIRPTSTCSRTPRARSFRTSAAELWPGASRASPSRSRLRRRLRTEPSGSSSRPCSKPGARPSRSATS